MMRKRFAVAIGAMLLACTDGELEPVRETPVLEDTSAVEPYVLQRIERAVADVGAAPRDPDLWTALGLTYLANAVDLAAPCLEEAARLRPDDARTWYHLGRARVVQGEFDGAAEALERAVALEPRLPHLHWSLGFWLLQAERFDEAAAAFDRAIDLAPDAQAALVGRAIVALETDDAETAAPLLEKVLLTDAPLHKTYVRGRLAEAYSRLGRQDEVAALGPTQAMTRPMWSDPWIVEANIAHRAVPEWVVAEARRAVLDGRAAWAVERLTELAAVKQDDAELQRVLGHALHRVGRTDEAFEALEEAVRLGDDSYELHVNLVGGYMDSGRAPEALEHARRAVQLRPELAASHVSHGRAAVDAGELEEGVAALRRAGELQGLDPRARFTLGDTLCTLERWNEAQEHLSIVTRSNPEMAPAWLGLARARAEMGRKEDALSALRRAQELSPTLEGVDFVTRRIAEIR